MNKRTRNFESMVLVAEEYIKKEKYKGLCVNCKHRDTCTLQKDNNEEVLYCEEYE